MRVIACALVMDLSMNDDDDMAAMKSAGFWQANLWRAVGRYSGGPREHDVHSRDFFSRWQVSIVVLTLEHAVIRRYLLG